MATICSIENCNKNVNSKNLCKSHYDKQYHLKNKIIRNKRSRSNFNKNREMYMITNKTWDQTTRTRPKRRYLILKRCAKAKNLELNISLEEYKEIIINPCFYCNSSIKEECGSGLDRLDNKVGYIKTNVVPCCGFCNRIKCHLLTPEETKVVISALLEFRTTKVEVSLE